VGAPRRHRERDRAHRLGTLVTPVARRRPWKLAKEIITLDHLSGGRVVLGVGLGFPGDDEFAAFGDAADDRVRAERLDEGLAVLDPILRGEPVAVHGTHFDVDADLRPGTIQRPRPPIWVAALEPFRRPLRRAARFEGVVPLGAQGQPAPPAEIRRFLESEPVLRDAMTRDGFDVVMSWAPDTDWRDYEAAGATWLVESTWPADDGMADLRRRVHAGAPR
jgi:alkanesulfonate monooxygenase SsuD/methylene tetrahydromethanopterin reductase-like flavin-dependent oxidoreductase (luciferase family)